MYSKVLIVTISPTPSVRVVSWPKSRVAIDDESFNETGAGDTNGFYDFLRLPGGHIIGIRFTPFVEHTHICDSATVGPGLRITGTSPTKSLELFWGTEREYDYALSAD